MKGLHHQGAKIYIYISKFEFVAHAKTQFLYFNLTLIQDVHCFGEKTCYSLAFGVPAILMFIATVVIIIGKDSTVLFPVRVYVGGLQERRHFNA